MLLLGMAVVTTVSVGTGASASGSAAKVGQPTVTGPVTGGKGHPNILATSFDLATVGYTSQEYFLSGTATAYTSAKPLTKDGRWTAKPASTAPYKTRIVVYRPADPSHFDGTVFVEWLNVTAGFESSPDWQSGRSPSVPSSVSRIR